MGNLGVIEGVHGIIARCRQQSIAHPDMCDPSSWKRLVIITLGTVRGADLVIHQLSH